MGVKDLWSILEPVRRHTPLRELTGQVLAVDLSVWICETQQLQGVFTKPYLRNIFFRVTNLIQLGIRPVFVIDGTPPEVKWETIQKRLASGGPAGGVGPGRGARGAHRGAAPASRKMSRSHFKRLTNECCDMLSTLGMPYVQSSGEAEAMCALLNAAGLVDACITNDGDAFLYGARKVYKNFTLNNKDPHVESYSASDIESTLKLDQSALIALALLLGCDYLPKGVPGVGKEMALKLLRELGACNVLDRLRGWPQDRSLHVCTDGATSKKPTHCGLCGHAGSQRDHKRQGCVCCRSDSYCEPDTGAECTCTWHRQQRAAGGRACEVAVWRKAKTLEDFPNKKVISEFEDVRDKVPRSAFVWGVPKPFLFHRFASGRMEWEGQYALDKVLPLLSLVQLRRRAAGEDREPSLCPHSIVKARVRQGVPSLEIQWYKLDADDLTEEPFYVTIENLDLFSVCYPKMVQDFNDAQATKKAKTKGKSTKKQDKAQEEDEPKKTTCSKESDKQSKSRDNAPKTVVDEASVDSVLDSRMKDLKLSEKTVPYEQCASKICDKKVKTTCETLTQRTCDGKGSTLKKLCKDERNKSVSKKSVKLEMHKFNFSSSDDSSSDEADVEILDDLLPLSQRLLGRASSVTASKKTKTKASAARTDTGHAKPVDLISTTKRLEQPSSFQVCNESAARKDYKVTGDCAQDLDQFRGQGFVASTKESKSRKESVQDFKQSSKISDVIDLCALLEQSSITDDFSKLENGKAEHSIYVSDTDNSELDHSSPCSTKLSCLFTPDNTSAEPVIISIPDTVGSATHKVTKRTGDCLEESLTISCNDTKPDVNSNISSGNFCIQSSLLSNLSQCSAFDNTDDLETKVMPPKLSDVLSEVNKENCITPDSPVVLTPDSPVVLSLAERLKQRQKLSDKKRNILSSLSSNIEEAENRFLESLSK